MKKEGESSCINDICLRLRSLPSKLEYGISRNNERRKLFIDVQIFYLQLEALICCETSCTWNMIWSTPYTFCLNFMDTYVILPSTAAWSYILRATWSIAETIFDQLLQLKMNYQFSLRIKIKNDFRKRYDILIFDTTRRQNSRIVSWLQYTRMVKILAHFPWFWFCA